MLFPLVSSDEFSRVFDLEYLRHLIQELVIAYDPSMVFGIFPAICNKVVGVPGINLEALCSASATKFYAFTPVFMGEADLLEHVAFY